MVLIERHAYVLFFAPDDVAGDAHAVGLKYQREILGDVDDRVDHVEGRPRDGHIANHAVDDVATERNRSGHQHGLTGVRAHFHKTLLAKSRRRVWKNRRRLRTTWAWYAARVYRTTML